MPSLKKIAKPALMMYAASESDSNLYYAVKFMVPDPFLFFRIRGRKIILMSDLELGRAQKQADVDKVISYSDVQSRAQKNGIQKPKVADVAAFFLRKNRVGKVFVPENFNLGLADTLRKKGITVQAKPGSFFEERIYKTSGEVNCITRTLRHTEGAIRRAEDLLRKSKIRGQRIYYQGQVVTSEMIKKTINLALMENNCTANHTIVAGGNQGCDPHCEGKGPIRAHQSIVIDVFPRSNDSFYYADITRTFVKGKAAPALKAQYEAVKAAQEKAIRMVAPGVNGKDIHQGILDGFESKGYKTEKRKGVMVGFFHGTGHGVGLDVHEAPRISAVDHRLKKGEVITIEPGLYYPGLGAVRIEDLLVVTANGRRNLTVYPKKLEIP
jgi:Xaa-Pro aminopeptidase